jgi:hypothetical protein
MFAEKEVLDAYNMFVECNAKRLSCVSALCRNRNSVNEKLLDESFKTFMRAREKLLIRLMEAGYVITPISYDYCGYYCVDVSAMNVGIDLLSI